MKFIDDVAGLDAVVAALKGKTRIYLDTEFDSSRRGTELCLVQVTAGEEVFVIDAQTIGDLRPLRGVLGGKSVEWILHAGRQDVELLLGALGFEWPPTVFDTQLAWALQSAEHQVSLAYLQAKLLGVQPPKGHQTDDWTRRPLSDDMRAYAAGDVAHLPALYDKLAAGLAARGRPAGIVAAATQEAYAPADETTSALSLSSFRNLWQLDAPQRAALAWLVDWYNGLDGDEQETAPNRKALFAIAARLPETKTALRQLKGVPRRFADQHGGAVVEGMLAAAQAAPADEAPPTPPPAYATFDEMYRDAWLQCARIDVCGAVEIAPELALPGPWMRKLREAIGDGTAFVAAAEQLTGWRALLVEPWRAFCAATGLR
ncbi:MAG: ribonuclease D [Myxococcales bacterium]|nr:ribonuclease D [Myxococcales bacterium]